MIKNIFLNYKSKPTENKELHGTYESAKNIGILYNSEQFGKSIIHDLQKEIEQDEKVVSTLGFLANAQKDFIEQGKYEFTDKDISTTGVIKNEVISQFTAIPFDFLIALDTSMNLNYKYVLASSKAICKIGFQTDGYELLLMMSLKMTENKSRSVKDLISYLKKI